MKTFIENKKALSPVIATIILVSITIVVAISVSYWMGSLAGTYTRFEKLEITSAYPSKVTFAGVPQDWASGSGWNITINVKNTGSADAALDNVFINGKPFNVFSGTKLCVQYNGAVYNSTTADLSAVVNSGASDNLCLYIKADSDQGITFSSGLTLDIKLHTASGKEYPKLIELT